MINFPRTPSGRLAALVLGVTSILADSERLPAGKIVLTQPSLPLSGNQSTGTRPVLVVDDDPSIREIIVETLELEGYWVEQAANGAEALKKIEAQLPSVVLLDMRMPVLDGWGLMKALNHRGLNLPIVVMTAAKNARTWASEIGASAFLDKPFEDTDLLAIVERFHGNTLKH